MTSAALLARYRGTWRAIGTAIVPELADADDAAWHDIETTIASALATRPPSMLRQLELLLRIVALLARARFGRSIENVDRARREQFLLALQRSPLQLVRRGIWGLRTLVLMGHYTRPQVMAGLGYRADARGWSARRPAP